MIRRNRLCRFLNDWSEANHTVLIDPLADNVRAHRFYERLGFCKVGPRRFGEDDCLVYRLEREGWKQKPET